MCIIRYWRLLLFYQFSNSTSCVETDCYRKQKELLRKDGEWGFRWVQMQKVGLKIIGIQNCALLKFTEIVVGNVKTSVKCSVICMLMA